MVKYFIPKFIYPHGLGAKYGSYLFPIYLTLEELRRYYPEPREYFTFITEDVEEGKRE